MSKKPVKEKQEKPHGPGQCSICKKKIPLGESETIQGAILIHKHKAHQKEMDAQGAKGLAAANAAKQKKKEEAAKAAPPSAPGEKPPGTGQKPEALKEGGNLASVRQPTAGAVQFVLGKEEIILQPAELYDAYLYYRDMVAHQNIHEPFTKVLKTSIKYIWELLNRQQAREQPASITPKIGVDKDPFEETLDLANKVAELRIIESVGHYP